MRIFGAYLLMELKQAWRVLRQSIGSLLMILVLTGVVTVLFGITMYHSQVFQKVKIGISIPEEETISKLATQYISSMDSIKSICEFYYIQEDLAIEQVKSGDLQAVIVLPEGFFHDVQTGINPPAQIYFSKDIAWNTSVFQELLTSGVSLLQTAESGVYAALSTSFCYGAQVSMENIGNTLAYLFAYQMLERRILFREEIISPLGEVSVAAYYYVAGVVLLLMMMGVLFEFLYDRKQNSVEDKLRIYGMGPLACMSVKIIVMSVILSVTAWVLYLAGGFLFEKLGSSEIFCHWSGGLWLLLLGVSLAVYFHVIYGIAGKGSQGAVLLFAINGIASLGTGILIPKEYLGNELAKISRFLPMSYWNQFCTQIMTGQMENRTIIALCGYLLVGVGIGAFMVWKDSFVFTDYR